MKVQESYKQFTPPFEVISIVKYLINKLPEKYFNGLGSIILTNYTGLPRNRRRDLKETTLGVYYHKYEGKPPYIYLFIDNMFKNYNSIILKFNFARTYIIAHTFYHEIAHHVHRTMIPKHLDAEFVADDWRDKFVRKYLFKSYYGTLILFKSLKFINNILYLLKYFSPFVFAILHYFYFSEYINDVFGFYRISDIILYIVFGILLKYVYNSKGISYSFIIIGVIIFIYGLIYNSFQIRVYKMIETTLYWVILMTGYFMEVRKNQ